jgi:chorismate mutase
VFKFRSVRSIVIAPAKTGRERRSNTTVIVTAHTNRGIRSSVKPCHRILITVVIKLTAPRIEEAPAKCREKIAKSTEGPACAIFLAKGG